MILYWCAIFLYMYVGVPAKKLHGPFTKEIYKLKL